MKKLKRISQMLFPFRLVLSFSLLLFNRARVHPTVFILGDRNSTKIGKSVIISQRAIIDVAEKGRVELEQGVWLAEDTKIETNAPIFIGAGTTIQRRCTINGHVYIGRGCILAPNVFISSGTHPFRLKPHLPIRVQESLLTDDARESLENPVWIQDDCWLGVNSVVCPGVIIGKGAVIGANSVVTRNVLPYSVVAGVPARLIGQRLNWVPKKELRMHCEDDWIFLLSGKIIRDELNTLVALEINKADALYAVLDPAVETVCVNYEAAIDTNIHVGNLKYTMYAKDKEIMLPTVCNSENNFKVLHIKLAEIEGGFKGVVKVYKILAV